MHIGTLPNGYFFAAGTPVQPNLPTLTSGKTGLSVKFNCPSPVWNSRYMTYELTRVDLGRTEVVRNADASAAINPSPRLVRTVLVNAHPERTHARSCTDTDASEICT